jgi:hypothetical protein
MPKDVHCDRVIEMFQPSAELLRDKPPWNEYWARFMAEMKSKEAEIRAWVGEQDPFEDITLCCWEHTDDHCHRQIVGKIIEKINPELFGGEVLDVAQASVDFAHSFSGAIPEPIKSDIKKGDRVYWTDRPDYLGFLSGVLTVRSINLDGTLNLTWVGNSVDPSRVEKQRIFDARQEEKKAGS